MNGAHFILSMALALGVGGCERDNFTGPPDLRLGSKECIACGMLVSEDRCSSAMLVEQDGRREYYHFDDLGCMLDQEREGIPGVKVIARFARDYDTRGWVSVENAWFLMADHTRLQTPMGSGIIGLATRSAAESALEKHGGKILDYTQLGEARRLWMEERYGRPRPDSSSGHAE